ncbi:ZYRO0E00770p [Zygosaccharomyces rouxii]|uniref:ZYRO0E00770p n=1 Tax=Zygosaccharomyces rouxii (strain ATCC 2623 / CBS 732 / NBRC 1130 / NCYC 568 / NRRL Y-229) TaxID=559307 RepID=C5E3W4_ZYGRC|nr:uncharacterized protein ZYRO0E00770g [Zygosaccharomyces rouxii]KAH9198412.1 flavoprotein [Zygosaccharomyces rouxii]CAR30725.1 ZYRO0E00770p [Zygosaccharomyces rouxii]
MVSMDEQGVSRPETKPVSILNSKPSVIRKDNSVKIGNGNANEEKKLDSQLEQVKLTDNHEDMRPRPGASKNSSFENGSFIAGTSANGSVDSSPQKQSGGGGGGTSAVSFTVSEDQKISQHRYSINSKPAKPTDPSSGGQDTALAAKQDHDSPAAEKSSIVHMPGDFIYFDSQASENKAPTPREHPQQHQQQHPKKELIVPNSGPQVPFTEFFQKQDDKKFHILLGATGSVATIKVPQIIDKLFKLYTREKVSIQLIVTKPAEHFLRGLKISTDVKIWREEDEWSGFKKMGDPVLHHELKRWADIFLVAPLSANTLAKIAYGICDNLLTCVLRDWTPSIPVMVAPAMNTFMYINPMTKRHLSILKEDAPYVEVLKPVEKVLICGDIGMGGMREWNDIVEILRRKISEIYRARDEKDVAMQAEEEEEEEEDEDEDDDEDEDEDEQGKKNLEDDEDEDEDEDEDDDDDDDDDDEDDEDDDDEVAQ